VGGNDGLLGGGSSHLDEAFWGWLQMIAGNRWFTEVFFGARLMEARVLCFSTTRL
jgi:hypothetical protein